MPVIPKIPKPVSASVSKRCEKCGKLFKKQLLSFECPYCGGQGGPSEIGKEFYIDTIEIE